MRPGQCLGIDDTRPLEIVSTSDFATVTDAAAWLHGTDTTEEGE